VLLVGSSLVEADTVAVTVAVDVAVAVTVAVVIVVAVTVGLGDALVSAPQPVGKRTTTTIPASTRANPWWEMFETHNAVMRFPSGTRPSWFPLTIILPLTENEDDIDAPPHDTKKLRRRRWRIRRQADEALAEVNAQATRSRQRRTGSSGYCPRRPSSLGSADHGREKVRDQDVDEGPVGGPRNKGERVPTGGRKAGGQS
jgi:hypothetical protein